MKLRGMDKTKDTTKTQVEMERAGKRSFTEILEIVKTIEKKIEKQEKASHSSYI